MQDFTTGSDIDWYKNVEEIDAQPCAKSISPIKKSPLSSP